ncbi:MAG: hypothetical protein R2697_18310 [Ilumatobacteraceae bacterium]
MRSSVRYGDERIYGTVQEACRPRRDGAPTGRDRVDEVALAAADAAKQQLDERVQGIQQRLDTPIAPPPTEPPPAPTPTVDPADVDRLAPTCSG